MVQWRLLLLTLALVGCACRTLCVFFLKPRPRLHHCVTTAHLNLVKNKLLGFPRGIWSIPNLGEPEEEEGDVVLGVLWFEASICLSDSATATLTPLF